MVSRKFSNAWVTLGYGGLVINNDNSCCWKDVVLNVKTK